MENDPYSLSLLRDIVEPAPIPFWPPAFGFWAILTLVLLWIIVLGTTWWLRWRRNAYRRAAISELNILGSRFAYPEMRLTALQDLSSLLKRVALVAYPRHSVASLSGEEWLKFLDKAAAETEFYSDTGRLLEEIIYAPGKVSQVSYADCTKLLSLSRQWIRSHRMSFGKSAFFQMDSAGKSKKKETK